MIISWVYSHDIGIFPWVNPYESDPRLGSMGDSPLGISGGISSRIFWGVFIGISWEYLMRISWGFFLGIWWVYTYQQYPIFSSNVASWHIPYFIYRCSRERSSTHGNLLSSSPSLCPDGIPNDIPIRFVNSRWHSSVFFQEVVSVHLPPRHRRSKSWVYRWSFEGTATHWWRMAVAAASWELGYPKKRDVKITMKWGFRWLHHIYPTIKVSNHEDLNPFCTILPTKKLYCKFSRQVHNKMKLKMTETNIIGVFLARTWEGRRPWAARNVQKMAMPSQSSKDLQSLGSQIIAEEITPLPGHFPWFDAGFHGDFHIYFSHQQKSMISCCFPWILWMINWMISCQLVPGEEKLKESSTRASILDFEHLFVQSPGVAVSPRAGGQVFQGDGRLDQQLSHERVAPGGNGSPFTSYFHANWQGTGVLDRWHSQDFLWGSIFFRNFFRVEKMEEIMKKSYHFLEGSKGGHSTVSSQLAPFGIIWPCFWGILWRLPLCSAIVFAPPRMPG